MKPAILCLFLVLPVPHLRAGDSSYQENLHKLRDRCSALEAEGSDYRKPEPRLSPEKQQELYQLQGQLLREDPLATLCDQILADIRALETAADTELIENLKDLLAHVSGVADQATSRAQADELANTLRQFVARRDLAGLKAWAKTHPAR